MKGWFSLGMSKSVCCLHTKIPPLPWFLSSPTRKKGLILKMLTHVWGGEILNIQDHSKTATINELVSISLDPENVDSGFIHFKYHKDHANDKDYSHEGLGFNFRKWQADQVAKQMNAEEVKAFKADEGKWHVQPKK